MPKKDQTPKVSLISNSEAETMRCAKDFAGKLKAGDIVFLQGQLGAGKTTFVKGLVQAFRLKPQNVNSPTFVLMNCYEGRLPLYHFDLYRLENAKALDTVDFDDYFYGDGISLIEWPERLGPYAPEHYYLVEFQHQGEHQRRICISCPLKPQPRSSR